MKKKLTQTISEQSKTPIDVLLGRAAMMGFLIAFGGYLTADVVAPGLI